MKPTLPLLITLAVAAGCASVESTRVVADAPVPDGLVYFLPERDFLVKVTVEVAKDKTVSMKDLSVDVTEPYADLSQSYVLRHRSSLVALNEVSVVVTPGGLLGNASANSTPTLLAGLAKAAETAAGVGVNAMTGGAAAQDPSNKCTSAGDHVFVVPHSQVVGQVDANASKAEGEAKRRGAPSELVAQARRNARYFATKVCGGDIEVVIKPIGLGADAKGPKDSAASQSAQGQPGYFYRVGLPYLIAAWGSGMNAAKVVFTPSGSSTYFLPVQRSLFASNAASAAFDGGVPTEYGQKTDGELSELVKYPAAILKAYFAAVGALFDGFKTTDTKKAEADNAELQRAISDAKFKACFAALAASQPGTLKDLGCVPANQ